MEVKLAKNNTPERIEMVCPKGNSPACPSCGNWNAMLDAQRESFEEPRRFICRDCGYSVLVTQCVIVIIKAEAPGMGNRAIYNETTRINGEDY